MCWVDEANGGVLYGTYVVRQRLERTLVVPRDQARPQEDQHELQHTEESRLGRLKEKWFWQVSKERLNRQIVLLQL